jgi:flavorubredoxin
MNTTVTEIAAGIYRLSTFIEPANFMFNQFLVAADQPLVFHCGLRGLFSNVSAAAARVIPLEGIRWICYGHHEADESGSMNDWLTTAPQAQVAVGKIAVMVSARDLAARAPMALDDGQVLDLGGKRVRYLATPHVPHGWDAGLLYEETTDTLLCGDLFTQMGNAGPIVEGDIVGPALAAEDFYKATALTPATGPILRRLAELGPRTLALMHGPSFRGDGGAALRDLAAGYEQRLQVAIRPSTSV